MKIFIFIFFFLITCVCHADDMQKHMEKTDDLINMGEYKEALERTIWFHNHALEHQRSMYGVRLSFALSRWYEFGKKYPPALLALKNIRDKKTDILMSGTGTHQLFHDVYSINETLSEDSKTIDLFIKLDKNQPSLAKNVWHIIKDKVILIKDYALIKKYIGNVLREYSVTEDRFKEMMELYNQNSRAYGEQFKAFNENYFVEQTLQLIDLAIALNDKEAAVQMKSKAKIIVKDYRLDDVTIN